MTRYHAEDSIEGEVFPGTALTLRLERIANRLSNINSKVNSYETCLGEYTLDIPPKDDMCMAGTQAMPARITVSQYLARINDTLNALEETTRNLDNIIL